MIPIFHAIALGGAALAATPARCDVAPRVAESVRVLRRERLATPSTTGVSILLAVQPPDENIATQLTFVAVSDRGTALASMIERLPPAASAPTGGPKSEALWRVSFERLPDNPSTVEIRYYWQLAGSAPDGRVCYFTGGPARLTVVRLSEL